MARCFCLLFLAVVAAAAEASAPAEAATPCTAAGAQPSPLPLPIAMAATTTEPPGDETSTPLQEEESTTAPAPTTSESEAKVVPETETKTVPEAETETVPEAETEASADVRFVPAEAGAAPAEGVPPPAGADEDDGYEVRFGSIDDDALSDTELKERYVVSALNLRKQRCLGQIDNRAVGGVCLDKVECALKGGRRAGPCPLLGSCCYFRHTCGQKSHYKVSHFVNPGSQETECDFRVYIYNRNICQVRVDMEQFSLAQPDRSATPDDAEAMGGWRCLRDRFTVESATASSNNLGFEALCGENTGQHIYIPVNATDGKASLRLLFQLADRSATLVNGSATLAPARWLLRITQLECAGSSPDTSSVHAAIAFAGQYAINKHMLSAFDHELLAPQGCLQYYPQRQGQYESFNYPGLRYFANLHYAICFRRRPNDCGISHTAIDNFLIDFNAELNPPYVNRACDTRNPAEYNYTGDDYLYVPNGIVTGDVATSYNTPFVNKICGLALQIGETISSYAPGPFFVYFHSDDFTFRQHISDWGFRMRFDVETAGCRLADPGTSGAFVG